MNVQHTVQIYRLNKNTPWFNPSGLYLSKVDEFIKNGLILSRVSSIDETDLVKTIVTVFRSSNDHQLYNSDPIISNFITESSNFYGTENYFLRIIVKNVSDITD